MFKLVVLVCAFAVATSGAQIHISPLAISTLPITYPLAQPYNYRGPLSLAPGQPAEILGADGRPLDTLEVNQDRAAHFAAKTGLHILKKRSAELNYVAQIAASPIAYAAPLPTGYIYPSVQPYNYRGPLSLAPGQPAEILGADGRPLDTLEVNQDRAAHFAAKTGLHILKKRSALNYAAPIAYSAPIASERAGISIAASPLAIVAHFARPAAYTAPFPTGYIAPLVRPVATTNIQHY